MVTQPQLATAEPSETSLSLAVSQVRSSTFAANQQQTPRFSLQQQQSTSGSLHFTSTAATPTADLLSYCTHHYTAICHLLASCYTLSDSPLLCPVACPPVQQTIGCESVSVDSDHKLSTTDMWCQQHLRYQSQQSLHSLHNVHS